MPKVAKYYKKQIAPRLSNGERREVSSGSLPPEINDGLKAIARKERKSVSWVKEQVIIDYFGMRKPKYKKSRNSK